jgi:hypothetical protein
MKDFLRRFRWVYILYNFFHKKQLYHNELLYKKLGLNKKYYSSISSKDFAALTTSVPSPPHTGIGNLSACTLFNKIDESSRQSLLAFEENGFAVINNYLSRETVDQVNAEVQSLLDHGKLKLNNKHKIMFAIHASRFLSAIGNDKHLKEILSVLLGGNPVLFQSINFIMGSEQNTHSDSIHMTTYPLGGLLGVWIALEDITDDNGPLHYYPGSHRLPYYLNSDYENEGNFFMLGNKSYADYEKMISSKITEFRLDKLKFLAKKGDLLIWHANLFHGGEPHRIKELTRKSMVLHYFKQGSVCYHEITQRPAIIRDVH